MFDGDSMVVAPGRRGAAAGAAVRRGRLLRRRRPAAARRRRRRRRSASAMTVERHESGDQRPSAASGTLPDAARRRRIPRRGRGLGRAGHRAARLRRARTASGRWCSGCPAASTRRWSRRSPPTRSAARTCTASRCRARTPPSTRSPTPPSWPSGIGAHYRVVPIAPMVDAFVSALSLTGLAEENVQARVRGTTLMALSNAEGHLVLATGNKSELAVGYSTIYGDAVGGFAPIKDVPKTLVWELARWRNARRRAPRRDGRRSRRTRSASRRRPSCARASSTPTRCPTTRCSTRSSTATSTATRASPRSSPRASTPTWSTGSRGWSTAPSGSGGSTRPARRSASRPSAGTGGCRSPTAGARRRVRRRLR